MRSACLFNKQNMAKAVDLWMLLLLIYRSQSENSVVATGAASSPATQISKTSSETATSQTREHSTNINSKLPETDSRQKTTNVVATTAPTHDLSVTDEKYSSFTTQHKLIGVSQTISTKPTNPATLKSNEFSSQSNNETGTVLVTTLLIGEVTTIIYSSTQMSNRANITIINLNWTSVGAASTASNMSLQQKPPAGTGYDKELILIFGVALSLMIIVVVILCIRKRRHSKQHTRYMDDGSLDIKTRATVL